MVLLSGGCGDLRIAPVLVRLLLLLLLVQACDEPFELRDHGLERRGGAGGRGGGGEELAVEGRGLGAQERGGAAALRAALGRDRRLEERPARAPALQLHERRR